MTLHSARTVSLAVLASLVSSTVLRGSESCGARPLAAPWSRKVVVDPFDPSMGTLISAQIVFQSYAEGHARAENLDRMPVVARCRLNASVLLRMPGGEPLSLIQHSGDVEMILAGFDGTADFEGNSAAERTVEGLETRGLVILDPALLSQFVQKPEPGVSIEMPLQAIGSGSMETAGAFATDFEVLAGARVKVHYEFVPHTN